MTNYWLDSHEEDFSYNEDLSGYLNKILYNFSPVVETYVDEDDRQSVEETDYVTTIDYIKQAYSLLSQEGRDKGGDLLSIRHITIDDRIAYMDAVKRSIEKALETGNIKGEVLRAFGMEPIDLTPYLGPELMEKIEAARLRKEAEKAEEIAKILKEDEERLIKEDE